MKVFYSIDRSGLDSLRHVTFVRADDACRYAPLWLLIAKSKTWRELLSRLPKEERDRFDNRFEADSDLDKPLNEEELYGGDLEFPPGMPKGLVRYWMPDEIIEKFGTAAWLDDVEFRAEDADAILEMLRHVGYECVEADALVDTLSFRGTDVEEVEQLIRATERELGIEHKEIEPKRIRFDPAEGFIECGAE